MGACDVDLRAGHLERVHQLGVSLCLRRGRGCTGQRLGRGSVAKGRTPLVAVLLRLVGGLGDRRQWRHARRRLHRGRRRSDGCPAVPIRADLANGWRSLGPDLRGRKQFATSSPGTRPKCDDHEALPVCREARVVALGQWTRAPEGTSPIQPLCLPRCRYPAPARLHGGGGVGAHRFQPPRRAGVL